MIRNPTIGQKVKVIASGEFVGCAATIVKQHQQRRFSRRFVGLKFSDHPWQRESPDAVWWFDVRELEAVS